METKPPEIKRLYRSRTDRVFAGICGGIAEYLRMDPVLIRLLAIVVVLVSGVFPGVVVYVIGIFVIPEKPL